MKSAAVAAILAFSTAVCGTPMAQDPAAGKSPSAGPETWVLNPNDAVVLGDLTTVGLSGTQGAANVKINERGLSPGTIAGPTFHPAWLPRVRPAAQAMTVAGHAVLMTAWIDAQNRINIILDAAFPGLHGNIIAGVQNLHNGLGIVPHLFELGKTYVATDNGAEIEPADTWRWFWFK